MNRNLPLRTLALALAFAGTGSHAYDSGGTGADGAFAPTVSTELQLPPDGVFNFSSVSIPAGVTVVFKRNAANTPVVWKVAGDVTVEGTIDVSGATSPATGTQGDGMIGDDGIGGAGGPGGYDGGRGGPPGAALAGGSGLGPGAGLAKYSCVPYGMPASHGVARSSDQLNCGAGGVYGNVNITPLVGGSGGAGGRGGTTHHGAGGGGGGGALLIAASGTVNVTGTIRADGGGTGSTTNNGTGGYFGGGGSGGAIKIVATSIAGNGTLSANGGSDAYYQGSAGRIRLEAENLRYTGSNHPAYSFALPATNGIPSIPSLRIVRVGGQTIAWPPSPSLDLALPAGVANPVAVEVEASGIVPGAALTLTLTPAGGEASSVGGATLIGSDVLSTATLALNLPQGPSVLQARASYSVTVAMGERLAPLAGGEPVREVRLLAGLDGATRTLLVTAAGREVPVDPARLAAASGG